MSVSSAGKLMGLSPKTIYKMIYRGQLRAYRITSRLTIIKRDDIEDMMNNHPHHVMHRTEQDPILEFYTAVEIQEKYGVSHSHLYKLAKKEKFPKVLTRGTTYWSKKHIDAYFAKHAPDASITEWYTAQEIMDKYGMTLAAVYCMASNNGIPKRKKKLSVLYSRKHVDQVKQAQKAKQMANPEYYTMKEAMDKYKLSRDQVYQYCRYHDITKVKRGKYTFIDKIQFDELLAAPIIP